MKGDSNKREKIVANKKHIIKIKENRVRNEKLFKWIISLLEPQ
jgi:hypothetical protein